MSDSGQKTESIGFRIDRSDLIQLRQIARQRSISLNMLVSQVLSEYLRLWMHSLSFGFVPLSRKMIRTTFAKLTPREAEQLGKEVGGTIHKEIILYMYGKTDKASLLKYLEVFSGNLQPYFQPSKHITEGLVGRISVFHDINIQFSTCFYNIVAAILALGKIPISGRDGSVNENSFTIVFDVEEESRKGSQAGRGKR